MKHKPKRFLALLLCAVMVFSLMPVMAMADDPVAKINDPGIPTLEEAMADDPVAKINETNYYSLADAFAAAKEGETIEIVAASSAENGMYELPSPISNLTIKSTVPDKEDGSCAVVFNGVKSYGQSTGKLTGVKFENIKIVFGNAAYKGFQHSSDVEFNDCEFDGLFYSYGSMVFNNCSFVQTTKEYIMWLYAGDVVFNNCTMTANGKFFNVYNEGNTSVPWKVTTNNCIYINNDEANKAVFNVKETCGAKALKYDVAVQGTNTIVGEFPEASDDGTLTVLNGLVQVDDRLAEPIKGSGISVESDSDAKLASFEDKASYDQAVADKGSPEAAIAAVATDMDISYKTPALPADLPDNAVKVCDGFYQNGATYAASTEFYITSKEGLLYFGRLVNEEAPTLYPAALNGPANYSSQFMSGKTVRLLADVDLTGVDWEPIGNPKNPDGTARADKALFYGTFDGGIYDESGNLTGKHVISNLECLRNNISGNKTYYVGLFGYVTSSAAIKNLIINNVNLLGYNNVGAVVGNAKTGGLVIENIDVTGNISIKGTYPYASCVGGIAGISSGTIKNCTVSGTGTVQTDGTDSAGIVGQKNGGTVSGCEVKDTVAVSAEKGISAGIVGNVSAANVKVVENTCTGKQVSTSQSDTLIGNDIQYDDNNKVISGTFEKIPESMVGAGFTAYQQEDGSYKVQKTFVAQIGDQKFTSINDAFAAVNGQTGDVVINILCGFTEELTDDYVFTKNVTITADEEVTVNLGFEYGKALWAIIPSDGHTLTVDKNVNITNLGQLFSGYNPVDVSANDKLIVKGNAALQQLWVYGKSTAEIQPDAHVVMGYGDGMIKLRYGGTLNVTGNGIDSTNQQLSGGYVSGDYAGDKVLNLKDTYMSTSWVTNEGAGSFAINLNNAVLKAESKVDLGAVSENTINMNAGSQIITGEFLNVDALNIDMTGATEGSYKVVDYTGSGTMTLVDYGTCILTGNEGTDYVLAVIDNDLCVVRGRAAVISGTGDSTVTEYFYTMDEALVAAQQVEGAVTVKLLYSFNDNSLVNGRSGNGQDGYIFTNALTITADSAVTVDLGCANDDGRKKGALVAAPGGSITIGENVTLNGVGAIGNYHYHEKNLETFNPETDPRGSFTVKGNVEAYAVYADNINFTLATTGSLKLTQGNKLLRADDVVNYTVNGKLTSAPAGTIAIADIEVVHDSIMLGSSKTITYDEFDGPGILNLTLNNTSMYMKELSRITEPELNVTLNGSYFQISVGDDIIDSLSMSANSVLRADNNLTLSNGASMTAGSTIYAKNFTNSGKIVVDMTGATEGSYKVVDYTGSGTMTLGDYGEVEVTGAYIAKVIDNDLCVVKAVAQVGTAYYETLADAIAAAKNGEVKTVQVLVSEIDLTGMSNGLTVVGLVDENGAPATTVTKIDNKYEDATLKNLVFATTQNGSKQIYGAYFNNTLFENCKFTGRNGLRMCYATGDVTFKDCTFDTQVYGAHFDGGSGNVTFDGCTMVGFNTFAASLASVTFKDCKFTTSVNNSYNVCQTHGTMSIEGETKFSEAWATPNDYTYVGTAKPTAVVDIGKDVKVENGTVVGMLGKQDGVAAIDAAKDEGGKYISGTFVGPKDKVDEKLASDFHPVVNEDGSYTPAKCAFDQKNTDEKYLKDAATCTTDAVYFYSCACGEKGTETFVKTGSALGHDWEKGWTNDGDQHKHVCTREGCDAFEVEDHTWEFNGKISSPNNCKCKYCEATKTITASDACSKKDVIDVITAGTFDISIGGNDAGQVTIEKANGGWYLKTSKGYLVRSDMKVSTSATPQVWQYSYGKFFQNVTKVQSRGFILWDILFGRKTISTDYYLTFNGAYGVNNDAKGATVVLSNTSYYVTHAKGHFRSIGDNQHEEYCPNCNTSLGNVGKCQYVDGVCKVCGAQDPIITGVGMFDINVSVVKHNFLFFKLYTANVYATSKIIPIRSVEFALVDDLVFTTKNLISTREPGNVIILITATNGAVYAYNYNVKTGTITPYDLL